MIVLSDGFEKNREAYKKFFAGNSECSIEECKEIFEAIEKYLTMHDDEDSYDFEDYDDELWEFLYERNEQLILFFKKDLEKQGLARKTIKRHLSNIDIFLNGYCAHENIKDIAEGAHSTYGFSYYCTYDLGATYGTLRTAMSSVKKFYSFLLSCGLITERDFEQLKIDIKESMQEWREDGKVCM